jgi:uncharacterized protein
MVPVEVVYSAAARQIESVKLQLPQASTVADALRASGLPERHGLPFDTVECGIWGRRCTLSQMLRAGDRVEVYRGLTVDPKEARRLRYTAQRAPKVKRPAGAGR